MWTLLSFLLGEYLGTERLVFTAHARGFLKKFAFYMQITPFSPRPRQHLVVPVFVILAIFVGAQWQLLAC